MDDIRPSAKQPSLVRLLHAGTSSDAQCHCQRLAELLSQENMTPENEIRFNYKCEKSGFVVTNAIREMKT